MYYTLNCKTRKNNKKYALIITTNKGIIINEGSVVNEEKRLK